MLERLDHLTGVVTHLGHDIAGLKTEVKSMGKRMDGIDARMDRVETRIDRVDTRMDAGFQDLSNKLDRIAERLDDSRQTQSFQKGASWVIGGLLVSLVSVGGWLGTHVMDRTTIAFQLPATVTASTPAPKPSQR